MWNEPTKERLSKIMMTGFFLYSIRSQTDLWKAKFENGFRDKYCCETHGLRLVNLEGFIMFVPED